MNKEKNNTETDIRSIARLLQAIRYDPVINKKVLSILTMDPYPRRLVLNNWLEQLHRKNAPVQLTKTLSYLFDDAIAQKVLGLMTGKKK